MYLGVPVDIVLTLDLSAEGDTLPDVAAREAEKDGESDEQEEEEEPERNAPAARRTV